MPSITVPRLYRNRCGVWCFRLRSGATDARVSLRTKDALAAHMMARNINETLAAAKQGGASVDHKNPNLSDLNIDWKKLRRYEADIQNGTFKATDEADHRRMMELIDRIGVIPGGFPKTPPAASAPVAQVPAPIPPSLPLPEAAQKWLKERGLKNKPRTVYAKKGHYLDFAIELEALAGRAVKKPARARGANAELDEKGKPLPLHLLTKAESELAAHLNLNDLTKDKLVAFKNAVLLTTKAKTVDNKLLTLSDFFEYALANGLYTVSDKNPVEGLLILTKTERQEQAEPYKDFTREELAQFFEPAVYKVAMSEPDFYWCPLIGLYSGMRISEATGIHCDDVKQAPNGVHYIRVRKSKTNAGLRNVPIAQALLDLGFLDFVAQQRAAGHDRLFPDRLLISDSYSKALSDRMLEYLLERGIRKSSDGSERKSFHSFRANVITELTNEDANTVQVMRIVGHDFGQKGIGTHAGYVRDLPGLKDVVDRMKWPIDVVALKVW